MRGARLARNIKPENLSLEMAEILGRNVSQSTVYKLERGDINLGLDLLMAALYVLRVNPWPLVELAWSDEAPAQAELIGREVVEDEEDQAWLRRLDAKGRARVRRFLDNNPS